MRIFFPNASILYPPNTGGHIHVYQLTKQLAELGHEIVSLHPDQSPVTSTLSRDPLTVARALRSADVVYCRVAERPNGATRLTSPYMRWLVPKATPVVWEFNVSITGASTMAGRSDALREADLSALRQSARRVDAAIGVTAGLTSQARDILGIERTIVIQNGSDPELFRRDLPIPEGLELASDKLHAVSIGSNPNSYHDIALVEATCRLIDERALPIEVHLFGRSAELCSDDTPHSLRLHGRVSYLDMPRYLAHMDVGLALYNIPLDLGSPMKLFDYLASGCVPICSAGQAVEEVLSCGNAGFIDSEWTPESLSGVLMMLHRDRAMLETMRTAGRRLVEQEYNWRRIAEKTMDLLSAVVDGAR